MGYLHSALEGQNTLIRDTTSKLVIVGEHSADEIRDALHNAIPTLRSTSRKGKASILRFEFSEAAGTTLREAPKPTLEPVVIFG